MSTSVQAGRRLESSPLVGQQITLRRSNPYVYVDPRVDILDQFYTDRHLPHDVTDDSMEILRAREPLLWPIAPFGREQQIGWAGLERLIADLLQRNGASVILRGKRPNMLSEVHKGSEIPLFDRSMLELIRVRDRGVIRYDSGTSVRPARLIAQMIAAWPKQRVMIATTRAADARRLADELDSLGVPVCRFTRLTGRHHQRVIVGTYLAFAKGAAATERRQMFIAVDPTELYDGNHHDYARQLIRALWQARMWALMPLDARPSPRLWDLITALFGVEEAIVPKHGFRLRPVHVVTERIFGGPHVASDDDDLLVRRLGITQHPVRNRRILRLARAIAQPTGAALRMEYPAMWSHLRNDRRRTCIFVDDVEHGVLLANKLGWPIATAAGVNQSGLPTQTRWVHPPQVAAERHVVATSQGLDGANRFDIVIRADAGISLPALAGSHWRQRDDRDDEPLVIVDFDDRHHPLLRCNAGRRRKDYLRGGWSVDGRTLSPLDVFLAERPEVWG